MKKLIFLLFVIVPFIAFSQKAKIEFENTSHNFGQVSETGGRVTHEFNFKNTGTAPLILTNVRAGCGCTTPEWSRQPVAPGASGKISVAFDPRNRPGSFTKSVTVNSNAENTVVSLTIRGNVTKKPVDPLAAYTFPIGAVKATAGNLNLGSITDKQVIEKNIEIINTGQTPANITVTSPGAYMTATVVPATLAKGQKGNIQIKYDAALRNDWGFVTDQLEVTVNNKDKGNIVAAATINEDFTLYQGDKAAEAPAATLSEKEIALGDLAKNAAKSHDFFIQNDGKSDLIIRKCKPSDELISAHPAKTTIKPGKKVKVTVSLKADNTAGKKIKLVQFMLNDPKNPIVTYKVTCNVL